MLDRDELVEPHGLLPREMERERVDREVRVASRLLEMALAAYGDVLALDHMLHRLVAQRAHLMHMHSCHVHGMHGTCMAHARGCAAGCAGARMAAHQRACFGHQAAFFQHRGAVRARATP